MKLVLTQRTFITMMRRPSVRHAMHSLYPSRRDRPRSGGSAAAMNFHVLWNPHGKLHKWMIQKWHAAFNGARHAHLILLHEKFHQIGLHIRIEQTVEPVRTAPRIPIASIRLVRGTRSSGQD